MRKVILTLLICVVLTQAAWAQDSTDLLGGFKLGKFYTVCSLLAMELMILEGMCSEFDLASCTQENLDNGVIAQDEMDTAVILMTYAQIRADTLIRSICEQGMSEDTFSHPALATFKPRIVPLIGEIWADTETFLGGAEPPALAAYAEALATGGYAAELLTLAEEAATIAGETE